MKKRRIWISLAGLALAAGLAGCSQDDGAAPTPSPTPSPPPSVTPSASPTPDMDALYEQAEWIVRRATELEEQAIEQGPGSYPAELEELLAEPYLSWSRAGVQQYWELGWTGPEGESAQLALGPLLGVSKDGSEVTLEACLWTTPAVDASGTVVSPSALFHRNYYLKHVDEVLKLFTASGGIEVDQCPIS